jgi:3-oxoacyl-[acyl-carrier protein] reductase
MRIIGFMRGLANDVANDGITANAVLPGQTNTLATAPQSEEQKRATWEQQAIKRMGGTGRLYRGGSVFDKRRCRVHYPASNRR